jgi:hypothetical protein
MTLFVALIEPAKLLIAIGGLVGGVFLAKRPPAGAER